MVPPARLATERAEPGICFLQSVHIHLNAPDRSNVNLIHPKLNLQGSLGNVVLGFPATTRGENTRRKIEMAVERQPYISTTNLYTC